MKKYIPRKYEKEIRSAIKNYPVVAIIGPRQCGKSTLAKHIISQMKNALYLDLEKPSDLAKLENAEWFLTSQKNKLICIDEIQRKPELYPLLRSLCDENRKNGQFLILGSASRELLKQSSESLAGRIAYIRIFPFTYDEIKRHYSLEIYLTRGGFPKSILTKTEGNSFNWRENFITTFLERDLLFWNNFPPKTMYRLWKMLAHFNGQTMNYSAFGNSLGISNITVRNYLDLLEGTFMIEVLPPYVSNLGKRLVKAPKVYISDSGIACALLHIERFDDLISHPSFGSIWEGAVLTSLKSVFKNADFFFYRTSHGAEVDIVMQYKGNVFCIECKNSLSPTPTKGFYSSIDDIKPHKAFIVAPVESGWKADKKYEVCSLTELLNSIAE